MCEADVESYFYPFKECQGVKRLVISSKWGFFIDNWRVHNMDEFIQDCIRSKEYSSTQRTIVLWVADLSY